MTIADKNAAMTGYQAAPVVAGGRFPYPLAEFKAALGLYALWATLAWLSVLADQTTLAPRAATVLFIGILATNALFLLIAKSSVPHRPPDVTIALSQCIMGITWATLFSFMSAGPGELVFGMYISVILFAVSRVRLGALSQLTVFATASYAIITIFKTLLITPQQPLGPEIVTILTLAGIMAWLLLYGRHLHEARQHLAGAEKKSRQDNDCTDQSADRIDLAHSMNRNYILDSLAREKGRTDRSNNPLSVCILDIDDLDGLIREYGKFATGLILQRFGKRVRGELRAMDGVNPGGEPHAFDRVGENRYIVLLPQTNLAGADRCANRIRGAIARYPIDGQYAITISGGIVEYQRGETVVALLERAEVVLARAHADGGNRVIGYDAPDENLADVIPLRGRF